MFSFLRAAILVLDEGSLPELFAKNCLVTAMSNIQKKRQNVIILDRAYLIQV